jgi:hypothetical protein
MRTTASAQKSGAPTASPGAELRQCSVDAIPSEQNCVSVTSNLYKARNGRVADDPSTKRGNEDFPLAARNKKHKYWSSIMGIAFSHRVNAAE